MFPENSSVARSWTVVGVALGLSLLAAGPALADRSAELPLGIPSSMSEHAEHATIRLNGPSGNGGEPYVSPRDPADRPDVTVYGYWPYWGDPMATVPIELLTHLAVFSVNLNPDGTLEDVSRWHRYGPEAMALAEPFGVKVHLSLTCFSDAIMGAMLPSASRRATTVRELAQLVEEYGAHGVNVDFEGLNLSLKQDFVKFIQELSVAVDEVYLAMPAVDWAGAYDFDELAYASEGLFIMGYGYHWSGGNPGPLAPLFGGGIWADHSLDWTVNDYRRWGTPDDRIVLGLPLYGRDWPTVDRSVPGTATGSGSAVVYSSAVPKGLDYGRRWNASTKTPYAFPSSQDQLWYDDASSLTIKTRYSVAEKLQGFGFWALTYADSDPELWKEIEAVSHFDIEVEAPVPGRAGENNVFVARGVTPGTRAHIVWGTSAGRSPLRGCEAVIDLHNPRVLGSAIADAEGVVRITEYVPSRFAGRSIGLQGVEGNDCEVGPAIRIRFSQ